MAINGGTVVEREDIIQLLKSGPDGVARWNERRPMLAEPPRLDGAGLRDADLGGADLHGLRLFRACLSGAQLQRSNLAGANVSEADLSRADLSGAGLTSAKLFRCNFDGAALCDADLSEAYLGEAELDGADLSGANLSGATGLTLSQLRKAHLDPRTRLPAALAAEFASLSADRKETLPTSLRSCLEQ